MTRQIACPVALHPDGAPQRIPMFENPQAGLQLVTGAIRVGERPEAAAARALYESSGLETRTALYLGASDQIMVGTEWHFALCRVAPPVRQRWQHHSVTDGGHPLRFEWQDLSAPDPVLDAAFVAALRWIRAEV